MPLYKSFLIFCSLLPATLFAQTTPSPDSVMGNPDKFERVEEEASFPGGLPGWKTFLVKNLNPNTPVDNGAPSGKYTVIVQFVVSKDGTVSNIKPLTHFGYGVEEEVVRIIARSGTWNPARHKGKNVNAYRKQPVTFVVEQEDGYEIITKDPYTLVAGIDNEITIKIKKHRANNVNVMISKGTITPAEDGKFIAKLNSPDRVIISVYDKKSGKPLCAASYDVTAP